MKLATLSGWSKRLIAVVACSLALLACNSPATQILIVNQDGANEGLNDPAPATPVDGNNGTTVGAQRLNCFTRAAEIWAARLNSTVPIRVAANFDPLSCSPTSGILGAAGPTAVVRDFAGAPKPATYYVIALANALAGTDLDPARDDIEATFNSELGTSSCLTSLDWYYGFAEEAPPNTIGFLDTVLHEMGHGLGFVCTVNLSTGTRLNGYNDSFSYSLENHLTGKTYPQMTDTERVAASKATGNLHWIGTNATAISGLLSSGAGAGGHIEMYAPNPQEPGSSVSHFSTSLSPDELMEPYATDTSEFHLTTQLFKDIGWHLLAPAPEIAVSSATISSESCGLPNGRIDPGEQVTVNLSLRNSGQASTSNLVATLLATNGVTSPTGPETYGVLAGSGGSATRSFSFTAEGRCGQNITLVLNLQDGTNNLGRLSFPFSLGGNISFSNNTVITTPNSGSASPYPSTIEVSGVSNSISSVTVTLDRLSHDTPDDFDVLLVGPGGQSVVLMSDTGGDFDVDNVTLRFDDSAASLSDNGPITSGTYRPTNIGDDEVFPSPAPSTGYGSALSVFTNSNPNGTWSLYVRDDKNPRSGRLNGGWSLSFPNCCSEQPPLATNRPPVLSPIADRTVVEATTLVVTNSASDPDPANQLTFSLGPNAPSGSQINGDSGVFTWTPSEADGPGTNVVVIRVSDNGVPSLSATQSFSITVLESNMPPALAAIPNVALHQGQMFVWTNSATDQDIPANTFAYSLSNAPAGVVLDSASGVLTFDSSSAATSNLISVVVSDQGDPALTDSTSFLIDVLSRPLITSVSRESNHVVISWNTIIGQTYSVEFRTNLVQTNWSLLGAPVQAATTNLTAQDLIAPSTQRFYRIGATP